jgi:ABC-type uncharacterized transport system substrate-binding protein
MVLARIRSSDPTLAVGAGFVDSMARPGGNVTGFTSFEYGLRGKWLELLKQIAPRVMRVGVIRDPAIAAGAAIFRIIHPTGGENAIIGEVFVQVGL